MNQIAHDSPSRLRRAAHWLASKPETTAWIAVSTALILAVEIADHVLGWF